MWILLAFLNLGLDPRRSNLNQKYRKPFTQQEKVDRYIQQRNKLDCQYSFFPFQRWIVRSGRANGDRPQRPQECAYRSAQRISRPVEVLRREGDVAVDCIGIGKHLYLVVADLLLISHRICRCSPSAVDRYRQMVLFIGKFVIFLACLGSNHCQDLGLWEWTLIMTVCSMLEESWMQGLFGFHHKVVTSNLSHVIILQACV